MSKASMSDDDEEYEETREGNRLLGFIFGNVDDSGDLDADYLDEVVVVLAYKMQTIDHARLREDNSASRPPYFDGTNYAHWKVRMKFFLLSQSKEVWNAVEKGYTHIDKATAEFTPAEKKLELANNQAVNHLFNALSENEFNRVSACDIAKAIWDTLNIHYEGTDHVKNQKLRILEERYEMFHVAEDEDIATSITLFTKLLNEMKSLEKSYDQETSVYKFLRVLPRE